MGSGSGSATRSTTGRTRTVAQASRVGSPEEFLERAGPLLLADEARHNLALGILATLRDSPSRYPESRLWLVEDGGEVVGAALRTPPHNLVLVRPARPEALEALAAAIDEEISGVVGTSPEVEAFAALWAARTGRRTRLNMAQGVYALERVRPVAAVAGAMRPAARDDRRLLLDWWRAFAVEAMEDEPDVNDVAAAVDHRLSAPASGFRLWDDGGPVSLAGFGGPTPNGIRIGPVYTPPELRGRGYASALVAALSAQLLAGGRRFCFLYTNLANPTANAIYRRIGYELVCESAEIAFS